MLWPIAIVLILVGMPIIHQHPVAQGVLVGLLALGAIEWWLEEER